MVKTKEELLGSFKARLGEDTSDETITLMEDLSDTLDLTKDNVNWKQKYEENDKAWREKYTSRFAEGSAPPPEPDPEPEDNSTKITYNDLFSEKE